MVGLGRRVGDPIVDSFVLRLPGQLEGLLEVDGSVVFGCQPFCWENRKLNI